MATEIALRTFSTSQEIGKEYPTLEDQLGYWQLLSSLKNKVKSKKMRLSEIEVQPLLADAIDKGLERGDVKVNGEKHYEVINVKTKVNPRIVDLWRQVRDVPPKERQAYYNITDTPNRSALLKWHSQRTVFGGRVGKAIMQSVVIGDFRKVLNKLDDNSIDLIFTDPPYSKKFVGLYKDMASIASDKLIDGGSLICYFGQMHLRTIYDHLAASLRYHWMFSVIHSGASARMREYGIVVKWKPLLWFTKGPRWNKDVFIDDGIVSSPQKSDHPWQQSKLEASYLIEKLTHPDGLVVDPFCGSGTTAIAAKQLGRSFFTCDVDRVTVKAARIRIEKA